MSFRSPHALNNLVPTRKRNSQAIVFIDTSIANWASITQKVVATARVVVIGSEDDGVREISKILNKSNCWEVHLVSSGLPGCVYLGNSQLSFNTFSLYSSEMGQWFVRNKIVNLAELPRIFIHGCNFGTGDVGEESIAKLNKITGARIFIINNLLEHVIFQ